METSNLRRVALLIISALLAPMLAQAEGAGVNAKALGTTEALRKYCAKAYPGSADGYRREVARLTEGASQGALAAARNSSEYRKAQAAVENFVGKVDPHNVKKMCSESVRPAS